MIKIREKSMMTYIYSLVARATALSVLATTSAFAHGDSGGGGGIILPAGITLVAIDYNSTKFNEISDARLTALALQGVEEVHSLKSISVPALTVGYGLIRDLTVAVRLPYLDNREIRETDPDSGGVNARGGVDGFGDASVTGTYRFYNDPATGLDAALILGVKAPTGPTGRVDDGGERFETEHQPGSGSWDGIVGATVSREINRVTLSADVLYQFSGEGTEDTTIGDRVSYGFTASYRVWTSGGDHNGIKHDGGPHHGAGHDPVHGVTALDMSLGLNGDWAGEVETSGETNENTGGNMLFLTPGLKLSVENWSAYVSAGIPVVMDLNGIQSEPNWRLTTGMSVAF
jgi:Putative MetA-pathway of phenol degradation